MMSCHAPLMSHPGAHCILWFSEKVSKRFHVKGEVEQWMKYIIVYKAIKCRVTFT